MGVQWNLRIKDTLGPAILSTVEKFSSSQRLKMNYCYRKGVQKCVLCWEVVPFSEDPLSEVPLYVYALDNLVNLKLGEEVTFAQVERFV